MNIKVFKAVLSIFIFTASLDADIDVRKEFGAING
jgi:hypothetical protein